MDYKLFNRMKKLRDFFFKNMFFDITTKSELEWLLKAIRYNN